MGKFRQFIISENTGLGDLGMRLNQAIDHIGEKLGGAFVASGDMDATRPVGLIGMEEIPPQLPGTDLTVPQIVRTGRIQTLINNRNPIYIRLSDGTEAHFSYDEYRSIKGDPAIGKTMSITFQRHPNDASEGVSKIDTATVLD